MELGQKIEQELDLDHPRIFFFVSTFCSKCIHTRKVLRNYLDEDRVVEIDISNSHPLLEELHPRMVPTLVVVNSDQKILLVKEGIIGEETGKMIANLVTLD